MLAYRIQAAAFGISTGRFCDVCTSTGRKPSSADPATGEVREAEIFVGVLGASNLTYAEATWTQHAYAAALAYALRYQGRKRVHNADEIMSEIVAKRLVEHLERAGFVVMIKSADRRRQRARGGRSSRGRLKWTSGNCLPSRQSLNLTRGPVKTWTSTALTTCAGNITNRP